MLLDSKSQSILENLKQELQNESNSRKLENLSAALLGRLLNVPIYVAKSSFQYGGDAGPSGGGGRRFRIECKNYKDSTGLNRRELLGEIDQALARDRALEAWFLVTTRDVSEQIAQDLTLKGEEIGVPVVIIDWKNHELPSLAVLCAFAPDIVETEFSKKAGEYAHALQPFSGDAIAKLQHELQSWCLGFNELKRRSHEKLDRIWTSPRASNAELAQNAAGGYQKKRVKRTAVHEAFDSWWQNGAQNDAPAAVIGWDGVGKTWAALDWLVNSKNEQPVVLIVPSSAATGLQISEIGVKQFLAERLYQVSGVRNPEHWFRRIDMLLKGPVEEGPVLTVFFDGINQESSMRWLSLLKVLQGENFAGRVRVIVSSRTHYFNEKLSKLRGLIVPAVPINVDPYSTEPGGELDRMLGFENLTQNDLHPDLIELARIPRLFNLVVRFRDRLVEVGQVTVHRLLWEYGRDTLGVRAEKSFSDSEWQEWLKEIAQKYREGIDEYSIKSLSETTSRPDLTESEVYARLSDIIDGRFAVPGPSGKLQLTPTVVAHALGTALLAHLDEITNTTFASLEAHLAKWLDPIAGLDQKAEILRAAVSIVAERNLPAESEVAGVLVTAWLQTQNVSDDHRKELAVLAPYLSDALLDAVEHSDGRTHPLCQSSCRMKQERSGDTPVGERSEPEGVSEATRHPHFSSIRT
ncbi:MAG: hypothetical protein K9N21_23320 [Deltaproteobacteria bacterium]|nr:hypothetical protein [Deltaproteobacteria bacterium]